MEASRSAREKTADTTLSRKLADFLVELSIALHKRAIYPDGHPYLRSSADRFADRVATLLESRDSITIGVARDRLVIESATTDPANALLRDLAHRLHRHQLASIGFTQGAPLSEIDELLAALGGDPDRGDGPLGRRLAAVAAEWTHVQLRAAGYNQLTLEDEADDASAGAPQGRDFWLALARAAVAAEERGDAPPTTDDDELIISASDREGRHAQYDSVVLGYLSQVAEEQSGRAGVGEARLRRRVSRLLNTLDPESVRRLLGTGADLSARQQPLLSASQTLAVDAVAEVLETAAKAPRRTISHSLLALLHKLAHQTSASGGAVVEPDGALRRNVARLISGWELDDPNPADYTAILHGMVREMPVVGVYESETSCDPEVVLRIAVEVDGAGPGALAAAQRLVDDGKLAVLAAILDGGPGGAAAREIWPAVATMERLEAALTRAQPDHAEIAIVSRKVGAAAAVPLLDALELATSRSNRAALLKHLTALGPACAGTAAARLPGAPWYLKRNILLLISQWGAWPDGFDPLPFASEGDVRVRREAVKLLLASDAHRASTMVASLGDRDDVIVALGLAAATGGCPPAALPLVRQFATTPGRGAAIRAQAVRVLARSGSPEDVELLVTLARAHRHWLRRPLAPRSPTMLAAIAGLAQHWPHEPRAAAVLHDALHHRDLQVRNAAKAAPVTAP